MSRGLTLDKLVNVECDKGMVGSVLTEMQIQIYAEIGEFFDVLCVALRKKKLAALDFSSYGKAKYRKKNVKLINEIIDFANQNDVKTLHYNKKGGMYIKTIFYYPAQKNNAYKLAFILWSDIESQIASSYMIGILLGYSVANIQKFIVKNFGITLSTESRKMVKDKLKKLKSYKDWVQDNIEHKKIVENDNIEQL